MASKERPEMRSFEAEDSSNVLLVAHDGKISRLYVTFRNNTTYKYENVNVELYEMIRNAESVGGLLHSLIISKPRLFPYGKVELP